MNRRTLLLLLVTLHPVLLTASVLLAYAAHPDRSKVPAIIGFAGMLWVCAVGLLTISSRMASKALMSGPVYDIARWTAVGCTFGITAVCAVFMNPVYCIAYCLPLGGLMNTAALAANGARMPSLTEEYYDEMLVYCPVDSGTRLVPLCDVICLRDGLGNSVAFSAGDLVISVGLAVTAVQVYLYR